MVDKMREEFFDWYYQQEQFGDAHQEELWKTWKASRESLAVNLPCRRLGKGFAEGFNAALEEVEENLNKAGISYK